MSGPFGEYAFSDAPIARNFWAEAVPDRVLERAPLAGDVTADVVVVGAGYTGLNAALALAEAGRRVVVLDRRFPGWGASGRNGGFCCLGGTRASDALLDLRHGDGAAAEVATAERAAIAHVAALADRFGWDIDRHSDGETVLAHSPAKARRMAGRPDFQTPEALARSGMRSRHHGGYTTPEGFALHPRKYLAGLLSAVEAAGAQVFGDSAVRDLRHDGAAWLARTATGTVRATRLILATNGYSSDSLLPWMRARFLPAQSSVIASRAMTPDELTAQGWTARQMAYENRRLLHYFHLTPEGQMVFGMRGGLLSSARNDARIEARVRRDFEQLFPAWSAVETPHAWSGLVCLTAALTPFCGAIPGLPGAFAAFGYHGNGVAMGSYCGAIVGRLASGQSAGAVHPRAFRVAPPRFPMGRARRAILAAEYGWSWITGQ